MNFLRKIEGIFVVGGLFCFALTEKKEAWKWQNFLKLHVFSGCFFPDMSTILVTHVNWNQRTQSSVNAYFDHRQCSKHWKTHLFGSTTRWETMSHGSPYFLLSHTKRPLVSKDFVSGAAGFPSRGELLTLYFFSLLCHTALFSSSITNF